MCQVPAAQPECTSWRLGRGSRCSRCSKKRAVYPMIDADAMDSTITPGEHQDAALELRRKMMGFMVSQAIAAVTDLGVADRLADGPATARELADAAGADPDALRRFLRALASEGLFAEDPQGRFRLTPMGSLLRGDLPGSLRPFVQLMTAEAYEAWGDALYSVRTGNPAVERVFGAPLFGWLPGHPSASARFDAGQAGLRPLRIGPLLGRARAGGSTGGRGRRGRGALPARLIGTRSQL